MSSLVLVVRVMSKIQRFTALRREKRVSQDEPNLPNPFMEIDDSDREEADEMNIIDNDSDLDSDIDVED